MCNQGRITFRRPQVSSECGLARRRVWMGMKCNWCEITAAIVILSDCYVLTHTSSSDRRVALGKNSALGEAHKLDF